MSIATAGAPPRITGTPPRISSGVQRTLLGVVAAGLGAVPLCQLISDRGWLVDVWLSMLVVVAPALLLRVRRPVGALQIWPGIILLIPWLTARYLPAHALFGLIPTRATLHDLGDLLDNLHRTTQDGVAPVHSTVAIKLALCAMLGLLAALVDLIAVVGRHGALAGVPLLVVYTVSGAVPRHAVRWQLFAFAAVGFLILLALDARDDLSTWGHRVRRPEQQRGRPVIAMSGQRIAGLALIAAVVLPVLAPTKATNLIANLVHGSGGKNGSNFGAGNGGSINPFVALRGELTQTKTRNLATVTVSPANADRPFYLRENVLSNYTGNGWSAADHGNEQSVQGSNFDTLPGPTLVNSTQFDVQIKVTGLTGNPPVFAVPTGVTGLDAASWAPQDQLLLGTKVHSGQTYHESVSQPAPTVSELETSPQVVDRATASWLNLPTIPSQVRTLVNQITAGKSGQYDKARAISDWFADPANGFKYSLQTASGDSGSDLVDFLTNRVGYCQQYAAAMAVMLRLAGVPARVVLGYTHQPADASGTFKITTDDAHAWDEAYFSGVGWIPFDPTPLSGAGGARASTLPWAPHSAGTNTNTATPTNPASTKVISRAPSRPDTTAPVPDQAKGQGGGSVSGWLAPLVVVLVLVLLALLPWFIRHRRRRQRLHAARGGDPDPLWAELTDTAVDLGYVWSPARSPRQVVRWLREPAGEARGSLTALAQAVEHSRYGAAGTGTDGTGRDLSADLDAVATQLRGGKNRSIRWRARFWPASLNWTPTRWRQRRER
ncbi:MAG: transglutaminase TgpA family protein [Jatrophihabitantaceae bacterium]